MSVEMAITLLLLDPLPWTYESALMAGIPLIGSTLLSLCCCCSSRHATMLTPEPSEGQPGSSFEKHHHLSVSLVNDLIVVDVQLLMPIYAWCSMLQIIIRRIVFIYESIVVERSVL